MATGASFVDFGEKRLLGNTDFDDRFLSHLRTLVQESFEKSFRTGVVYDVLLTLSAAGNDAFDIGGTSEATDGGGHLLDIAASGFASGIQFENAAAIDYEVALHYAEVPDGIQVNPRKGFPEYVSTKEFIGESADPSTVVDNTTTLTFGVDSVAEAGVSHAGRTCRVFKKIPGKNGTTPSIAIEDVAVVWTGTVNEITTTGVLGQESPNSTALADYTVVMLGPTVRRNTTLLAVDGYAFVGIVTGTGAGNPPVTFDTTGQELHVPITLSDLSNITSFKSTSRLRIDIKSFAGDVGEAQLLVRNPSGTPVFQVDGNGNLTVAGTTTQQDVVQVNSSETITDNLTAGDNDAVDSHLIKGTWRHTDTAGTATYFRVNGASGNIDIGGNMLPIADNTHDLGSVSFKWDNIFVNNLSADTANIDILNLSSAAGEGVGGDLLPTVTQSFALGSSSFSWGSLRVSSTTEAIVNRIQSITTGAGLRTALAISGFNSSSVAANNIGLSVLSQVTPTSGSGSECVGISSAAKRDGSNTLLGLIAYEAFNTVIAGTVTNNYGFLVKAPSNSGTITTNYGFYAEAMTAGVTNYAIFTNTGLVRIGDQMTVGTPTGGFKGAGTINAQAVYDDNVLLTDFVFESDYRYAGIDEMGDFCKREKHLPTIPGRDEWEEKGSFSLGKLATRLWETVEVHALYILELHERIKRLETGLTS